MSTNPVKAALKTERKHIHDQLVQVCAFIKLNRIDLAKAKLMQMIVNTGVES